MNAVVVLVPGSALKVATSSPKIWATSNRGLVALGLASMRVVMRMIASYCV